MGSTEVADAEFLSKVSSQAQIQVMKLGRQSKPNQILLL
jgi:hypothetical protein